MRIALIMIYAMENGSNINQKKIMVIAKLA